jgi:signal transduction histidine kinase
MAKIRTRARAVDMLGRQQIAGISNAVSELFKNAYDAYATLARIDYFEAQRLLVIRDNGVGMTKEDFEGKWLVLGTESKLGNEGQNHYVPPDVPIRPISGEKGIGRLAIALLGRQVLVLSRAQREDGVKNLVMALVHWGLFELPGINLDEIDVPVKTFPGESVPNKMDLAPLTSRLLECVDRIATDHPELSLSGIRREVESFKPDPVDLDEFLQPHDEGQLSLSGGGTGTHFLIGPATDVLNLEIATEERLGDYSFRKYLMGFYNEVFLATPPPPIRTSFRHWRIGATIGMEMLDPDLFFTAQELSSADQFLTGHVDAFGQFSGTLRVYDKTYQDLAIPWKGAKGTPTECGEFQVVFGYIIGNKSESTLAPEDFDSLNTKLNSLGGMYVYRDGIRILPYGDHSYDWLEVEKRRNKGAGHYFFSFRRMFGAVILTRQSNSNLVEKAGREGWQQNKPYRQLRDILMELLINLAAEFFRKGGTYTDSFEEQQSELRHKAKLLEKRQKQVSTKKKKFTANLDVFFEASNSGLIKSSITTLRQEAQATLQAAGALSDHDQAASALIRAERIALEKMRALSDKYTCKKPAGIGLSKDLKTRWSAYQSERSQLEQNVFTPFRQEIEETLGTIAKQARVYVNQRRRLDERLSGLKDERDKLLQKAVREAKESASETRNTVFEVTQRAVESFDGVYRRIETDLERLNLDALAETEIDALRQQWEEQLIEIEQKHRDALDAARDMLTALSANLRSSDGSEPAEIIEAIEERMIALEDQADEDFEMVQLGLAVAIINHEFAAAISSVRRNIQELGFLARGSQSVRPLYESIRSNFEHLDGHLNLFTPLQRRLHRKALKITGKQLYDYVQDVFSNRLERHSIKIEVTDSFFKSRVECYPSTIYPVFINLVDNAIYWLTNTKGSRIIWLDATADSFVIANNGEPIADRDARKLFERGFTRKSGGHGLGLFIARKALEKEKMDIGLRPPPPGFTVAFELTTPTLVLTT